MPLARMSGAVLIYCAGVPALAVPIGLGWFKCSACGQTFRGVEQ